MKKISINDFKRGWIIGNFEPSLLKVDNLEVGLKSYNMGDEDEKHYHKFGTEISFLIVGSASFNGKVLKEATMHVDDVAKAVLTIYKLPLDTNILNLTIMANKMPYLGRG